MSFDKNNPFLAAIIKRHVLNKHGSKKCTLHLTLDISGSHLQYKVGDSIAVYPENSPILVKETLDALKAKPHLKVIDSRNQEEITLEEFLTKRANLARVTKKWIEFVCNHSLNKDKDFLCTLLKPENKEDLKFFIQERQLWDFLKEIKSFQVDPHECMPLFSPLLPRFYSIASCQKASPNTLDLLIAYFNYTTNQHIRHGVASHYLCEMVNMHTPIVPIYIHPSKGFTLPKDPTTPIIMIGPGTGVAPFRGFMQERMIQKSTTKNWLFFGDWNRDYDFYYEDYWIQLEKQGHLKLSTAFSRDQDHKVYVQNRLIENASEIWKWIQDNAVIYVCGDATHMAKDVDETLHNIVQEEGHMSSDESKAFVKQMKEDGRYLRDVY